MGVAKNITSNIEVTNHLLPFFWQHGEDEATLREYVGVIQNANCQAFCVESRPHPDFCGHGWWRDMDVILDEAQKRGMQVWILDDSHFPSGYANGALREADPALCRQSVCVNWRRLGGSARAVRLGLGRLSRPHAPKQSLMQKIMYQVTCKEFERSFDDDRVLGVTAFGPAGEVVDLAGKDEFEKPEGNWELAVTVLTRNLGPHKCYVNMMSRASVGEFINACYEPHWEHYGELFGTTIAGFFSDEPELGNGALYAKHNSTGLEVDQDLPWSEELGELLAHEWGSDWANCLPLLWKGSLDQPRAQAFRVCYMDCVSRLVSEDFSLQIGNWCRSHGVRYIGHTIEDDDTHTCTGSGLGHFFRAMAGQDWAGIDCIGGQVLPGGEDEPTKGMLGPRSGGFYHYTLGKLGASLAQLDPSKHGDAMCEIFGNYGWGSGVYEQKYLADHMLVRGINNFVPHAFSPAPYPDRDCPPHFYAHGNNPQYRAFGKLCGYMNRVASCISGGAPVADVAIWYNAESDWAGACMPLDVPARALYDAQVDYLFLPTDHLERAAEFKLVVVPSCDYAPIELASLQNVAFVDRLPANYAREGGLDLDALGERVVPLAGLVDRALAAGVERVGLSPASNRLRVLHYRGAEELFLLVNEGASEYCGALTLPVGGTWRAYDAWADEFVALDVHELADGEKTELSLVLGPRKSLMLIRTAEVAEPVRDLSRVMAEGERVVLASLTRSLCRSVDYPIFGEAREVSLPDEVSREKPKFSGFIRYETSFEAKAGRELVLCITEPAEAVEVFVNGMSAGIQVVPNYVFDLTGLAREGVNELAIELATTLARENAAGGIKGKILGNTGPAPTGLMGKVELFSL